MSEYVNLEYAGWVHCPMNGEKQITGKLINTGDSLFTINPNGDKIQKSKLESDIISRQSAINAIENTDVEITAEEWDELTNAIKSLPPVETERKKGEWIEDNLGTVICSECKRPRRDNRVNHTKFCNSCGAKMKGADDD